MAELHWYDRKKLKADLQAGIPIDDVIKKYGVTEKQLKTFYKKYIPKLEENTTEEKATDKNNENVAESPKMEKLEIQEPPKEEPEQFICGDCQSQVIKGQRFCNHCGAQLVWQ